MKSRQAIIHNQPSEESIAALERWQMDKDPLDHLNKPKTKKLEEAFAILAEENDHFSHQNQ